MADETGRAAEPFATSRRLSGGKFLVGLVLCLVGIAILVSLGTWQVERLRWKEALVERIDARIAAEPAPLTEIERRYAETGDVDYEPTTVSGRYLNEGERYFFSTYEGEAGWNVYAPLLTADREVVFVNRGFVPYEMRDPSTRPQSQPAGEVTVTGLARDAPAEKPGYFVPDNEPARDIFFWRDLGMMAEGLALGPDVELVPFFIDAGPSADPVGLPIGGQTVVDIPNNHLQYAVTWYGLGLVLAVMTVMLVFRQWRYRKPTDGRT